MQIRKLLKLQEVIDEKVDEWKKHMKHKTENGF